MRDATIDDIQALERRIFELGQELAQLRARAPVQEVPDYEFRTLSGPVRLSDLFGDQNQLLVIHNMGQGCRYCTLWADGFNGLLPHLEAALAVVLVSRDEPALQQRFAASRGWRFRLASHAGGSYLAEQGVGSGGNLPGAVLYEREGARILRRNACQFGPGDQFCALWPLLSLAGLDEASFTPQFSYWLRPQQLDDGGVDVLG